jgi:hypothetical protein
VRRGAVGPATRCALVASLAMAGVGGPSGEVRADEAAWEVAIDERLELVVGTVANAKVRLRGRGRYSVARSGLLIDLKPARGLGVRQRRYQRGDAVDGEAAEASFSIPVRGEAVGAHALELRVRFWVCAAKSCLPVDERRTVAIEVREPPPPPPPEIVAPPPPVAPPVEKPAPKTPPARK